jgi:hypothetical protein
MITTGEKTSKEKMEGLMEDLIQTLENMNFKQEAPVVHVAQPNVVVPEQKAPTIVIPEQKAPVVTVQAPVARKPFPFRIKIKRDNYGDTDYIDIIPLP